MSDSRCLVTVVGTRNQVDLSIPADAPIAEYVDLLARMCGQTADDALPPAWSLATIGSPPLPVTTSLASVGITDGQVLYLRDTLAGEADEPVVRSVWEIVSTMGETGGSRWGSAARARVAVLGGVIWLMAGLAYLSATDHGTVLTGGLAAVVGIGAAVTARLLRPHARVLSRPLRVLLACAAIPCFVLTSVLSLGHIRANGVHLVYGEVGALLGLMIALAAVPDVVVAAVTLIAALALVVTVPLLGFHAGAAAVAGTVVAVGTLFLAVTPRVAGMLTAASWLRMSSPSVEPDADPQRLAESVRRAHQTLVLLTAVTSVAVAIGLVALAGDGGSFSLALAGVATVALLLRCGAFTVATEAIGPLIASAVGAFGLIASLDHWTAVRPLTFPLLVVAGLAGVGFGLPILLWRAGAEARDADPPRRFAALLTVCQIALTPLLLGIYGVFGLLWGVGNHL